MKLSGCFLAFHIFGFLIHLLLVISLVAIGYFDFMELAGTAASSAELFQRLASNGDEIFKQLSIQTLGAADSLLSAFKALATASVVALLAHAVAFLRIVKR